MEQATNKNSKENKLSRLRIWLSENNIAYLNDMFVGDIPDEAHADIIIPDFRIAISADETHSEYIYNIYSKAGYRTFFIRNSETIQFIFDKMSNCISNILLSRFYDGAKKLWNKIGYGKQHRHHLPINFDGFLEEMKLLSSKGTNMDEIYSLLYGKYKAMNTKYFQERHNKQVALEKERRRLKKELKNNPHHLKSIQKKIDANTNALRTIYRKQQDK